jgi:hypothetical protein
VQECEPDWGEVPYFSGKHRVHGMNVQVIAGPVGTILRTSGALLGKTHPDHAQECPSS